MDFLPPPNRDDYKDIEEYKIAFCKWQKDFEKAKILTTNETID